MDNMLLCEHIFFIIERISDILNFDNGRNQILTLCQELSHDERMTFLELHSNYMGRAVLETKSDDEIRRFVEPWSDYPKIVYLDMFLLETHEREYGCDPDRYSLINLYLPDFDKQGESLKMYRELSDDDKEEFLYRYTDSWRYKILKYLEFRPRWFHKCHWKTLFHIITLLTEGKEVVLSKNVKEGIGELQKGLLPIYNYLREKQVVSESDQQLYLKLSYIADSSDDLLDRVMSNHVTAHDIRTLLQTIHNLYTNNPSSTNFKLKLVVKNNINRGGRQKIANPNITLNHTKPSNNNYSRPKSYGHVPNPPLIGFNREIQILLNHLIQPQDETRVVGIVGAGGSGKTTLAKHIYHHPQISARFTRKVWVCLSQSWDKTSILNQIWQQVDQDPEATKMNYDQVVYKLSLLLGSQSYLVILDDIWSIKAWYDISPALPARSGSKVMVTTRNKWLPPRIDHCVLIVEPKQLNDEECYELFKKRAVLDENDDHELKSLGMEMVKKCKGLPLAVVALAGVLGSDKRLSSWERISKRVSDKMLNMENDSTQGVVKEILALSYYDLPQNLKPSALYLRVFPEDYVIRAQQLIEMWMAECLVDEEDEAEEYVDELANRCIIEVMKTDHRGQVVKFRIHDLIREMFINIDIPNNQVLRLAPIATRFDDGQKKFDSSMKFLDRDLYQNLHARSLIFFNFQYDHLKLRQLCIKLKLLRVLILNYVNLMELPVEMGNLIHLRYLKWSGRSLYIPGFIGDFENLLTLDLQNLCVTERNTINLEKLKELRHLYLPWMEQRQLKGVEKLKKLKTLWGGGEGMLSVMPKLSHALQELLIWGIEKEEQVEEVFRTPSITSNNLHTLKLYWECQVGDMSMMSKCKSITKLTLRGSIKEGTPLMFPPNLIHLGMINTKVEEKQALNIISESCPRLKILHLHFFAYTGTEVVCNENSFPQLEKLEFDYQNNLKRLIIGSGAMPRLNHLKIEDCPLLEVNDEARELISKLAPSFIPKLTFPPPISKRKKM